MANSTAAVILTVAILAGSAIGYFGILWLINRPVKEPEEKEPEFRVCWEKVSECRRCGNPIYEHLKMYNRFKHIPFAPRQIERTCRCFGDEREQLSTEDK